MSGERRMTLKTARCTFSVLLAHWVLKVTALGYEVNYGEAFVLKRRKIRLDDGTPPVRVTDAEHKPGSYHYDGLAADMNLYDLEGTYVSETAHPIWQECGKLWESLHPLCRWGGSIGDGNHLAFDLWPEDGKW